MVQTHSEAVFIMLTNVKMPTIVGILTFMSRINFVLSWVEQEKVDNLGAWKFQLKFEVIYMLGYWESSLQSFSQLKYFGCYKNIGPHIHFQIGMQVR